MKRYNLSFRFSRNGTAWSIGSAFVNATSESDAIAQIRRKYPYVENIRVVGVK
jgi:hypothetical protein